MRVICRHNKGYYSLTEGREYEVKELLPQLHTRTFTFPRYVSVIDDTGKVSTGHAYRFDTLEGISCEEYIKENIKDNTNKEY